MLGDVQTRSSTCRIRNIPPQARTPADMGYQEDMPKCDLPEISLGDYQSMKNVLETCGSNANAAGLGEEKRLVFRESRIYSE